MLFKLVTIELLTCFAHAQLCARVLCAIKLFSSDQLAVFRERAATLT